MKISFFQGIVFAIFGVGAIVGIFAFSTYKGGGGSAADAVGKVVIWGTLPKEGVMRTVEQINRSDSALEGVSYVEKNENALTSDLASAIATGSGPDLILTSHEHLISLVKFITPVTTETLPPNTFTNAFIEAGNLLATPTGTGFYGMPFTIDPLVLFWNDDILSSNGIAKPPQNWEGVVGLVPTLAVLTPSKQITRGAIALGSYGNIERARAVLSALFLQTGIPVSEYASGGLRANLGETSGSSGRAVLNFYTQFADPTKVSYTWNSSLPSDREMFQTGDLALYIGFASEARSLAAANPNLNFKVAPLPQPGNATLKGTYGLLYSFSMARGSKNASGAYQVMARLTRAAEQGIAARETGLAPTSRTALTSPPTEPVLTVAYTSALYARGWLSPAPVLTDPVFSSMIGNVITGRLHPEAALNRASAAISSLLRQ